MAISALEFYQIRRAVLEEDGRCISIMDTLCQAYPERLNARSLMFNYLGNSFKKSPIIEFVSFTLAIRNINSIIIPMGFAVKRDGGHILSKHWIDRND